MDYEILIWLESPAEAVQIGLGTVGVLGFIIFAIMLLLIVFECRDSGSGELVIEGDTVKSAVKKGLAISILMILLSLALSPIANFSTTYKKLLIYRGINSILADKAITTADKALMSSIANSMKNFNP